MRPTNTPSPENQNPSPIPSGLLTRADPRFASQLKRIEDAKKQRDQKDQEIVSPIPPAQSNSSSPTSSGAQRWEIQYGELKLEQKLGQGAFGEVFSGSYRKSKVAIKLYDFRGKLPFEQAEMLLKEADVMEGLRSEYLVGFRGICLDPCYALVMEFCEGGTLRARLDKTGEEITPLEQLRWAMQISYGLYQLHSARIVHRDLKGENILLDGRGHAKVADFGLSIVKSHSASHSKTGAGRGGAGTIPWMAPELHEDKSNSHETDVYSLGVVLWEIVSRKMPYAGLMVGQMISKTVTGRRDPLPEPCPEVFRLMITACSNLEAKQRPTAEQVGDQFAAALKSVESIPIPAVPESPKPVQVAGSNDEEMQKLKAKMEQLKLAHEQQQRAATEEKQRLEEEKQQREKEIERLKQQHQAELKHSQEKTAPPPALPPTSQSRQILMPTPKPAASLELQYQLIVACKQGDEKKVTTLLKQGAKPDMPNAKGERPLGAAVWGMCPDVVNALLKEAKGIAPMTWDECEKHNLKYYKEVFNIPNFYFQNYDEWNALLQKMDPNPFIRELYLKKADKLCHDDSTLSWDRLQIWLNEQLKVKSPRDRARDILLFFMKMHESFKSYRSQIKQDIRSAKQPTVGKNTLLIQQTVIAPSKPRASPAQLALQDQLIAACKQGDEKTVSALLNRGARPDIANAKDEHPLGAAVWGMCPDVVNALLKQAGGVAPMAWRECEQHNQKYYKEVFIVPKFDPQTYRERYQLLQKMDPNPFIQAYYLKLAGGKRHNNDTTTWETLKARAEMWIGVEGTLYSEDVWLIGMTEKEFVSYRSQIKQGIEYAKKPTAEIIFS